MRTQTHDVLKKDLIVDGIGTRFVTRKLYAEAAEFRRLIIEHQAVAQWIVDSQA